MPVETDLPQTILAKTREGKLPWERLSSSGFVVTIGINSITVDSGKSGIVLRLVNEEGLMIERFNSGDRSDTTLEEIYELARRQALRVDDTLLDIKRSLENL